MSAFAAIRNQQRSSQFKQILIATDFSDASERAFEHALSLARHYGAALSIVHAIAPEPRTSIPMDPVPRDVDLDFAEAHRHLKHLGAKAATYDLKHHVLLEKGRVWDVLAPIIQRENVDLLVLGTRGRGGLTKLVLGSVAEEVLRLAPCPVLTIGPQVKVADSAAGEFSRILFATDFGPTCAKAFSYALSLAEDYRAKLVLLHMVPPMPIPDLGPTIYCPGVYGAETVTKWQETMRTKGAKNLRALLPADAKLAIEPEYIVGTDFVPEGILDVAAANKSELIVMGAKRASSSRVAAHIPWALTHEIICNAKCPVLTVSN